MKITVSTLICKPSNVLNNWPSHRLTRSFVDPAMMGIAALGSDPDNVNGCEQIYRSYVNAH